MAVNDFGSDYSAFNKSYSPNVPRSVFDKSQLHSFTTDFAILRPFYLEYTVPGDDYDISVDTLIKSLALVHPPLTRVRYFIHFYYQKHNNLWHQFDNFVTLGNTGKMDLEPPHLSFDFAKRLSYLVAKKPASTFPVSARSFLSGTYGCYYYYPLASYSDMASSSLPEALTLSSCFGLPPLYGSTFGTTYGDIVLSDWTSSSSYPFVDAMPYAMYQSIYRSYYLNKDMAITAGFSNSQVDSWQPLDLHNFALQSGPCLTMRDDLRVSPDALSSYDGSSSLGSLYTTSAPFQTFLDRTHLRDWRGDYFTTSKLWPQRGNPPELSFGSGTATIPASTAPVTVTLDNGQTAHLSMPYTSASVTGYGVLSGTASKDSTYVSLHLPSNSAVSADKSIYVTGTSNAPNFPRLTGSGTASVASQTVDVSLTSSITVQNLATLEIINLWQQRNAYTDGTYNQMINAQFGVWPGLDDYSPIYIGGQSGSINFTEVLATSESDDIPLGEQAGHGITVGNGHIGHVHSNDYGMIMGIISIMPDTMYHQGIPREMTKKSYLDYYYPLFNGLGPQEVFEKELYFSGDSTNDDKVFGYQGRYDEMRYKPNLVSGQLANLEDEYWKAWTLTRHFDSAPNLNYNFLSSRDIRHDSWAYNGEPPFIVQIATRARAVRPLPSQAPMVTL